MSGREQKEKKEEKKEKKKKVYTLYAECTDRVEGVTREIYLGSFYTKDEIISQFDKRLYDSVREDGWSYCKLVKKPRYY